MDTQPLNRDQAPTPAGPPPRRRWCSTEAGDTGTWVVLWVAIFVPLISTANNIDGPEDLLWTVIIIAGVLGLGAAMHRLFKKRA